MPRYNRASSNFIDLTGKTFGLLTVQEWDFSCKKTGTWWYCTCDCGSVISVRSDHLRLGHTMSCGCYNASKSKSTRHDERLYHIWTSIKARCYNPKSRAYKNYGARGISMCDEWRGSYDTFKAWALANGYTDELTIDRIDNNDSYYPSNCRWATVKTQANNRRSNYMLTIGIATATLSEWLDLYQMPRGPFYYRIASGWSVEEALTKPTYVHEVKG